MIDALVSEDEFHEGIGKLARRISLNLIYVRDRKSLILAPLFQLAVVVNEAKRNKKSSPEYAKYLMGLEKQWLSIIAHAAIDHPMQRKIFEGIPKALSGEYIPKTPPKWINYFSRVITTGDEDRVLPPTHSTLVNKNDQWGRWGASTETAADVHKVLNALRYPLPSKSKPGVKSKRNRTPKS